MANSDHDRSGQTASGSARVSVVAAEVFPGREEEFLDVIGRLHGLVRQKGLGSNQLLQDANDPRLYYDIRTWASAEDAERWRTDPEIESLISRLATTMQPIQLFGGMRLVKVASGEWQQDRRTHGERRARERRSGADRRRAQRPAAGAERRARAERRTGVDRRQGPRRLAEMDAGPQAVKTLLDAARVARDGALAHFSGFRVGAALETIEGRTITGFNIENASYGLTMCAERVALFAALAQGYQRFVRLAVVTDMEEPAPPCGACRQLLWEYGGNLEVVLGTLEGRVATRRLSDLLPEPFVFPS